MTRPMGCDDGESLMRVRRGTLGAEGRAAFMEHLRVCEDCWSTLLIWRSLDPGPPPPNPQLKQLPRALLIAVNGFLALVSLARSERSA